MSLDGAYDPDNIFAKIIRGDIGCAKVFEDAAVLSFMDAFPQSEGHVLVISKTSRARNLLDVAPDDLQVLMLCVQKVARAIVAALRPDGLIVTQFNGAPAGQSVFHLHVHLIPQWEAAALASHGRAAGADPATLNELARRIAAEII